MKKIGYIVFALLVCVGFIYIASMARAGSTLYVGTQQGDYSTFQAAIDAASGGDTVIVRNGTYTGTGNKEIELKGKAITLKSAGGATNCTIDCEDSGRAFYIHESEGNDTVIDGFTIKDGNKGTAVDGGGIRIYSAEPTIRNCVIESCEARNGAGVYLNWSTAKDPVFENCVFKNNTASRNGGGIWMDHITPVFTNCTIENNTAADVGGGIYNIHCATVYKNCVIKGNTAEDTGGGICFGGSVTDAVMTNCIVKDNEVTHSTMSKGGALYVWYNADITLNSEGG